jgi:hypothetical protein
MVETELIKGLTRPEYRKQWYATNREDFQQKIQRPITCSCGFVSAKCNLIRHQKTKLHFKKLSKL